MFYANILMRRPVLGVFSGTNSTEKKKTTRTSQWIIKKKKRDIDKMKHFSLKFAVTDVNKI